MASNPYAKKTEEVVNKGGFLAQLYFDMHARSKEGLQNLSVGFTSVLDKEDGVVFAISEIEEPIENEDNSFSTYIKATILFSDFPSLCKFITKYTPVSIEIVKPENIKINNVDFISGIMEISEVIYNLKFKIYKESLSEKDRAFINSITKAREDIGRKLRKG
jgi:hypothetical protein